MTQLAAVEAEESTAPAGDAEVVDDVDAVDELLVEEISIDGMCGVY